MRNLPRRVGPPADHAQVLLVDTTVFEFRARCRQGLLVQCKQVEPRYGAVEPVNRVYDLAGFVSQPADQGIG